MAVDVRNSASRIIFLLFEPWEDAEDSPSQLGEGAVSVYPEWLWWWWPPFRRKILMITSTTARNITNATISPMHNVKSVGASPDVVSSSGSWGFFCDPGDCFPGEGVPHKTMECKPGLQSPPVHSCCAKSFPPWQYLPPCFGAGLTHCLLRNWRQSWLQEDQEDHDDHPPSTFGHCLSHLFASTEDPSHSGPNEM